MYKNIKLLVLSFIMLFLLCSCGQTEESSSGKTTGPYERSEITENSSDTVEQERENAIILDNLNEEPSPSSEQTNEEPSPSSEQTNEISICPNCNGEVRIGTCENCQGTGYDKKTKQICVKCLHTGKKKCEQCEGYGMIDRNGKGTSGINDSGSQSRSVETPDTGTYYHHSSECWYCHGNGLCKNCGGTGGYTYNPTYAGDYCRTCDGTGRCPGCNGKGIVD